MKLSEKKRTELYNVVHEEVMKARLEITKLLTKPSTGEIADKTDLILYTLSLNAPQKAIDLFK